MQPRMARLIRRRSSGCWRASPRSTSSTRADLTASSMSAPDQRSPHSTSSAACADRYAPAPVSPASVSRSTDQCSRPISTGCPGRLRRPRAPAPSRECRGQRLLAHPHRGLRRSGGSVHRCDDRGVDRQSGCRGQPGRSVALSPSAIPRRRRSARRPARAARLGPPRPPASEHVDAAGIPQHVHSTGDPRRSVGVEGECLGAAEPVPAPAASTIPHNAGERPRHGKD